MYCFTITGRNNGWNVCFQAVRICITGITANKASGNAFRNKVSSIQINHHLLQRLILAPTLWPFQLIHFVIPVIHEKFLQTHQAGH